MANEGSTSGLIQPLLFSTDKANQCMSNKNHIYCMCRIDNAQSIMLIVSLINNNNSYDSYTKMTALMKIVIRITNDSNDDSNTNGEDANNSIVMLQ